MTLDYFHQTITAVKNNIYFILKNTTVTARGGEKRKLFIGVETNLQLHISVSFTQPIQMVSKNYLQVLI